MTNAIIWTQNRNLDCVKAVSLANRMGLTVEVRNIDSNQWDLAAFQVAVPGAKILPQIVIGDSVLGSLNDLVAKSKEQQAATPKVKKTKEECAAASRSKTNASQEAKKASISDRMQAYAQAKVADKTPEQINAANAEKISKTKARLGSHNTVTHEEHVARYEAKKVDRAARIDAVKANNADARTVRIAAKTARVAASVAARRLTVGID